MEKEGQSVINTDHTVYLTSGRYRGTYCTLLSPTAAQAVRGRYLVDRW